MAKPFKRHFRIYFKNNHPAYIVDEEGDVYVFHRVTHSKTSGGRKNWFIEINPIQNHEESMYIVKQEQRDKKNRFSPYILSIKKKYDVSFKYIKLYKKTGPTQNHHKDGRATNATSITIKPKKRKKHKEK